MKLSAPWSRCTYGGVLLKVSGLIILTCLLAPTSRAATPEIAAGDLYAIVVGVAKYKNPKIHQLTVSDKDATDFAEFLKSQKGLFQSINVTLLRNEEATKSEVEKHLYYKLRRAGKDDTVILFFSGHGADDPNLPGEFFFLTYDADPEYLAATAVHMSRQWFLQKLDSRRIVLIADACHAGGFAPQGWKSVESSIKSFMNQFRESEGRVILTSSRPDERSLEKSGWQNSIFTHYLLLGLRGEADADKDGVISLKELYDFVYSKTKDATGGLQHPQWEGKVVGAVPIALASRQDRKLEQTTRPQPAMPSSAAIPSHEPLASLDLHTEPSEADVFIAGKPVGTSDRQGRLFVENLPLGQPLTVVLRKKGWLEASVGPLTFFSGAGPTKKTEVKLKQALGSVDLIIDPPDADVYAGERHVGRANSSGKLTITDLPLEQPIQIKAKKAGWLEASIGPITFSDARLHLAERRIELVRAQGSLSLTTDPGGAEVYLDGKLVGITNPDGMLALDQLPIEKPLLFKIKKKKWLEASLGPITFSDNKLRMAVQPVRLKPALGSIGLSIDPPGVDVYTGDRFVGSTDASGKLVVTDLPLGEHIFLRARKTGWQEANIGPVTFSEDKLDTSEKRIKLLRAQGTLGLITDPGAAEVYLDGKLAGVTEQDGTLTLDKLPIEKPITFKIRKKDWLEASLGPITFSEDRLQITDQRIRLRPAVGSVQIVTDPPESEIHLGNNLLARSGQDGTALIEALPLGKPLKFSIRKPGWMEASLGPLTLSPYESSLTGLQVKLAKALGSVEIITDPAEADVYIDDILIDKTKKDGKLVAEDLSLGTPLTLKVKKDGWLEASVGPITLSADGRKPPQQKVRLKPAVATLGLRTDPGTVAVKMDGRAVGTTDRNGRLEVKDVRVTVAHELEFQRTGYEKESVSVSIPVSSQGTTFENQLVRLLEKPAPLPAEGDRPSKEDRSIREKPADLSRPEGVREDKQRDKPREGVAEKRTSEISGGKPSGSETEPVDSKTRSSSCICCFAMESGGLSGQGTVSQPRANWLRRSGIPPRECSELGGEPCGGLDCPD